MGRRGTGWASFAIAMFTTVAAAAVTEPPHLAGHDGLELADGRAVRAGRVLEWQRAPRSSLHAYGVLAAEMGPGAQAVWDPATGVPSRIWGPGIVVPGSCASAKTAAAFAKAFLARHVALLAPGSAASDFMLVSNDLDDGMRTLGFVQHAGGLVVLGGQVSFRFKHDRLFMIGSEALPHAHAAMGGTVAQSIARAEAEAWLLSDLATTAAADTSVEGPFVLPLITGSSAPRFRTVLRVTVHTTPLGKWHVYVDARNGAPVAREQTLRFATAQVNYNVPLRRPGTPRFDYPAIHTSMTIGGTNVVSDAQGIISWSNGSSASAGVSGPFIDVNNSAGSEASTTLMVSDGAAAVWTPQGEYTDAQVTTFVHGNQVKAYVRGFADLPYVDELLPANVNINDSCNAFYNGSSINFFRATSGCGNTGRIADVVYHEFGHALHDNGIIDGVGAFDGAASEGLSDYLAATITGDPAMGRGFFASDAPLRHVDPDDREHVWPDDIGEIHYTGLIIAGALWDMRKALVRDFGEAEGVKIADRIFYQAMRRAVDIPTMYFEALAADDDDGDLTNGTPHICQINEGFTPHGLREITAIGSRLSVEPPHLDGYTLSLAFTGLFHECDADVTEDAQVEWRLRGEPDVGGVMTMALGPTGFEAVIPTQPDGSVVQYRVTVVFGDGDAETYPTNAADPWYELFVGHVEPLYCTDFETDPFAEGWSHGLSAGDPGEGADDWQWGETASPIESGDPKRPYSGDHVIGNDLGVDNFNGAYQPNKENYALSPAIDTSGYDVVRLHYRRWLSVEDARFDVATVYADDEAVWQNLETNAGDTNHVDAEWRFSDVDLSAQAADGNVVVRYELRSDGGLELGGWTIDDFCVVGYVPTVCGDSRVTGIEACDDGDLNSDVSPDACRSDCVPASCGDGVIDTSETCDDGNLQDDDGCDASCQSEADPAAPGGGGDSGDAGSDALNGIACACHTAGGGARSWPYAVLFALAAGLWRRRRFVA